MHRRPLTASVVAIGLLLLTSTLAAPVAAEGTATTAESPSTSSTVTPVLSARRVPGLLAAHRADAQLAAAIQPILGQATATTCLTVTAAGRPVMASNGDLPVMPASTEKLL